VTYWHAPDALRGGLNVLHYGLGARLIQIDGETIDEGKQVSEKPLHDGLAPHIGGQNISKDLVFRLAAPSELAGGMVQLRSTTSPARWPTGAEFFVPTADESGWRRVAAGELATEHAPQYFVFDAPVTTDRIRVRFPDCHSACSQVYLQEIQAIAVPGHHPEDLPPINAANLELGGHVLFADPDYAGPWNRTFLETHPTSSNQGWYTREPERSFVVGFHQNRAARLQAIAWIGDPEDGERIPEARIETSIVSPAGPWTTLDALPSPPEGELRSVLEFDTPVWARYLRITLPTDEGERRVGPDALEAIEAPGQSVVALWEDDQPAAAYEAETAEQALAAVPPAGGADRESAVRIETGSATMSSVLIERNEDWWRLSVPGDLPQDLTLDFGPRPPAVATELLGENGQPIALDSSGSGRRLDARLAPGDYLLRIHEPPRSVVIAWDTSGSVAAYRDRTLAAVRTWARSLQPGRDALQLLPFRREGFILDDWAERPEDVEPALRELPEEQSSASEAAMMMAADALADRRGARGIVIITDAETGMEPKLWPVLIDAMPRVVSLSIDSDSRENAAIMMDWAALNGGRFRRVIGALGLADGMDMANALFRAPKAYEVTATLTELVEPEGEATLVIAPSTANDASPVGAVELILDASGSMLQRMEGRRRIDIAHDALERLVSETLPAGTPFAFRAFGLEADACRTELVVPLGPLDREDAARKISGVPAVNLAKTAIADSLRAAREDLAGTAPPRVVVLVTDGEETCGGDPGAAIAELRASGLDARINIVGFAIDDADLAETFAGWADSGGGTYFNAGSAEALETSIAEALKPRFEIVKIFLDGRTEVVGNVALDEPAVVPAGRLRITPASGAVGDALDLDVTPNGNVQLDYRPTSGLSPAAASSPTDSESARGS
jgi:Mg-chelatase subunit ChlD